MSRASMDAPYLPRHVEGGLLVSTDKDSWQMLRREILRCEEGPRGPFFMSAVIRRPGFATGRACRARRSDEDQPYDGDGEEAGHHRQRRSVEGLPDHRADRGTAECSHEPQH